MRLSLTNYFIEVSELFPLAAINALIHANWQPRKMTIENEPYR